VHHLRLEMKDTSLRRRLATLARNEHRQLAALFR
jgi:hypothetical protein